MFTYYDIIIYYDKEIKYNKIKKDEKAGNPATTQSVEVNCHKYPQIPMFTSTRLTQCQRTGVSPELLLCLWSPVRSEVGGGGYDGGERGL